MGLVISTSSLAESLLGDWAAFDERGEPVDVEIPRSIGPAAFLVSPVTDAVKRIEADVIESLDRDGMWAVEAIVLNRVVLTRLGERELNVEELIAAVRELGYSWQISPVAVP